MGFLNVKSIYLRLSIYFIVLFFQIRIELRKIFFLSFSGALSQSVDMTVDKMMPVTEGDRVGFTCKISGDPRTVSYARSGGELITSWITIAGRCDKLQAPDTTLYTASCDRDNSMFYMTILNVTSSFHHINITCEAQYGTDSADTVDGFIFMEVNGKSHFSTSVV